MRDWREYLNSLVYCFGCGRFSRKTTGKPNDLPNGWRLLYQPHQGAPPGLPVCGPVCNEKVLAAMRDGPVTEPLIEGRPPMMDAGLQAAMLAEAEQHVLDEVAELAAFLTEPPPDNVTPLRRRTMPKITIIHDQEPQDNAMLQALYSRSPASVDDHLSKVESKGSGTFMERYYIGYGHRSIGDCGSTTIFIEGVTMLAAKAIQDWPLYSGQESSTRYMDFSTAEFFDPLNSSKSEAIQERWREFYLASRERVLAHLREKYPKGEKESDAQYDRAINARSFDILRGFLPAGATTNLSWHTNMRQARDHLAWLEEHPALEICELAQKLHDQLAEKYPYTFSPEKDRNDGSALYRRSMMLQHFLDPASGAWADIARGGRPLVRFGFDQGVLLENAPREMFTERPKGVELPRHLGELGVIRSAFTLDFGSYRDLQRHRAGIVRMPLLTPDLGFHPWYLRELPPDLEQEARGFIEEQTTAIRALRSHPVVTQNYIGMGFQVPCQVTQTLPAYVYRLELRSGKTIHPTLRQIILKEIEAFEAQFPAVPLYVDKDPDDWSVRRGKQTIEERS